jgi:hypothetical protein
MVVTLLLNATFLGSTIKWHASHTDVQDRGEGLPGGKVGRVDR